MKRVWLIALSLLMVCSAVLFAPARTAQAEREPDELTAFVERHTQTEPSRPEHPKKSDGVILFWDGTTGETTAIVPTDDADETARGNIKINKTNFPDDIFRKLLLDSFGRDYMTQEQADAVRRIDVTGMGIGSLQGVAFFKNLEILYCGGAYDGEGNLVAANHIQSLDVSQNAALYEIYCDSNGMTELKLSDTEQYYRILEGSYNNLTVLDLRNTFGGIYYFSYNQLTTVLLPPNEHGYEKLYLNDNRLTSFDPNGSYIQDLRVDNNQLTEIDMSYNTSLFTLTCSNNRITSIKLSDRTNIEALSCMNNRLTELVIPQQRNLQYLYCMGNEIESLDLSEARYLAELMVSDNLLSELHVENKDHLEYLDCSFNLLTALDTHGCEKLKGLACVGNGLTSLDLEENTKLEELYCYGQAVVIPPLTETETGWSFDAAQLEIDTARMLAVEDANYTLEGGIFSFETAPSRFTYLYDTQSIEPMDVTLFPPYAGNATVIWTDEAMQYNGKTPYMLYDGKAKTPEFEVLDEDGNVILPVFYTYEFKENTRAGSAYLNVRFYGTDAVAANWFKILLPPSAWLTVENVAEGILLQWAPVDGAAGYVIYRRAWSTTTNGWTSFERWWNVPGTSWIDGSDDQHKVYAGSRYQYGVKAYFERRVDPVSGQEIGGNFNEPSGNYNLGIVSALKTTVRITTRVLNEVIGGDKQIQAKWTRSQNFTGYQVQIATDEAFSADVRSIIVDDWKTGTTTFRDLKANTTYYVRLRSYHIFEEMTYYGQWSNVLSGKTK